MFMFSNNFGKTHFNNIVLIKRGHIAPRSLGSGVTTFSEMTRPLYLCLLYGDLILLGISERSPVYTGAVYSGRQTSYNNMTAIQGPIWQAMQARVINFNIMAKVAGTSGTIWSFYWGNIICQRKIAELLKFDLAIWSRYWGIGYLSNYSADIRSLLLFVYLSSINNYCHLLFSACNHELYNISYVGSSFANQKLFSFESYTNCLLNIGIQLIQFFAVFMFINVMIIFKFSY